MRSRRRTALFRKAVGIGNNHYYNNVISGAYQRLAMSKTKRRPHRWELGEEMCLMMSSKRWRSCGETKRLGYLDEVFFSRSQRESELREQQKMITSVSVLEHKPRAKSRSLQ